MPEKNSVSSLRNINPLTACSKRFEIPDRKRSMVGDILALVYLGVSLAFPVSFVAKAHYDFMGRKVSAEVLEHKAGKEHTNRMELERFVFQPYGLADTNQDGKISVSEWLHTYGELEDLRGRTPGEENEYGIPSRVFREFISNNSPEVR